MNSQRNTTMVAVLLGVALTLVLAPTLNAARFGTVGADYSLVARPPLESDTGGFSLSGMEKLITQQGDYVGLAAAQLSASERFVDLTTWTGGNSAGGLLPIAEGLASLSSSRFVIEPEAGESLGDPIAVYFHLVRSTQGTSPSPDSPFSFVDHHGHVGFDPLGPPAIDLVTPQTRMQMLSIGDSIFMSTGSHVFLRNGDGPFVQDVHLQASFDPNPPPPPICLDMPGLTGPCVPEPGSALLCALGVLCSVWIRNRSRGVHSARGIL